MQAMVVEVAAEIERFPFQQYPFLPSLESLKAQSFPGSLLVDLFGRASYRLPRAVWNGEILALPSISTTWADTLFDFGDRPTNSQEELGAER
jgi:hypothetical protein